MIALDTNVLVRMIREHARDAGCESIATFDRDLLGDDMFSMP